MSNTSIDQDGFTYRLSAERGPGGFIGRWKCAACDADGGSNHPDPTPERALDVAEANLHIHHVRNHHPQK